MDSANVKEQAGLSRRDFLKLAGAGLASLALTPLPPEDESIQGLFYRIAASALPKQIIAGGAEYETFPGKEAELLRLHRALTAIAKLETVIKTDPAGLEQARRACRKLAANPAIWTDGLIQPLADQRRIAEYLNRLQSLPWETGSAQELLRQWFELNRRDKHSLLDPASLEFPRANTLGAAIQRWDGESPGRFPTQLVDFSEEDVREINRILASFPEEILAKIVADPTLRSDGQFDAEYGEPVVRLQPKLLAEEMPVTSPEFFKLYLVLAHEFIHALDIFTSKNLWQLLPPAEALRLVILRAELAGGYPKLFADQPPFPSSETGSTIGLPAEFLFNSAVSDLPSEPTTFRRQGSTYGWLIALRTLANQNMSADEGKRLLWTPAGASGNLTAATDAWVRYQTECFAETAAALISLKRLKGLDLGKWHQEPELQYFRLMGKSLARQGIVQVPLGEAFRQLKLNVR